MDPEHHHSDYAAVLATPFGALGIRLAGDALAGLEFLPPGTPLRPAGGPTAARVAAELEAYFADPGHRFALPLHLAGTDFRQAVWQELLGIPPGETRTYGEIAGRLHSGPRAVGQAVGDNPVVIVVPCHRVVAVHGLGGFMHGRNEFPLAVKRWLLRHEGIDA